MMGICCSFLVFATASGFIAFIHWVLFKNGAFYLPIEESM